MRRRKSDVRKRMPSDLMGLMRLKESVVRRSRGSDSGKMKMVYLS